MPYFSTLSSLYSTLDEATISQLEQAIILGRVRAFKESLEIFKSIPDQLRHNPVIAIEYAQMLWRQWSLSECSVVLEEALEFAHKNANSVNDHGIYTLLRILKGKLNVFTKGDFTVARDAMREMRIWLAETPINAYGDIEVQCLVNYYFLMMCAVNVSDNFDVKLYRQIPRLEEGHNTENSLSQLRENLQARGCLRQAQTLLGMETFFLESQSAKEGACESLLQACLNSEDADLLWDAEGWIRLDLASFWNRDGRTDAAQQQFRDARSSFAKAPVPAPQNNAYRYVTSSELKAKSFTSASEQFHAWTKMYGEVANSEDISTSSTASTKAAEAALEILKEQPTDSNRKIFWEWQTQAETILESARDLYFLYLGHVTTGVPAFTLCSNFGGILQWHESFEAKYPEFSLWDLRKMAKSTHQIIYTALDDENNRNTFRNAKEISEIIEHKKLFWEETPVEDTSSPLGDVPYESDDAKDLIPSLKMPKNVWFREWTNHLSLAKQVQFDEGGIESGTTKVTPWLPTIRILLRWMRQGVIKDQLSESELDTILNKTSWHENSDTYELLNQLSPERLSSLLFGSHSTPTSCDHWFKVHSILSHWLLSTQDHSDIKIKYLLYRLQVDRTSRLIHSQCSAQDKLVDAERLLEMQSALPEEAQQLGGRNTSSWRNIIGSCKVLVYQTQHGHVLYDEGSSEFQEILALYQKSLEEEQEEGRLIGQANTYMLIAELHFFAAQKLRPGALDPFQEALKNAAITFQKMREGWKNLHGWEKVDKVLSASEEQRRLSIYPLAMGVIRELPDTLQDVRGHKLWSTIQAAKSIGLGWLTRVNKAETSEYTSPDSIARLSDFRELPTISPEEVALMTADVGGEVVYIDWYRGSSPVNEMQCPLIAVLLPGQAPQVSFVKMTWEAIDGIVDKWLKYDVSDLLSNHPSSLLQELSPLLEPLGEITKPGQVLVFSATGDLHRVPLHAIKLDGECLIRRNPIVYTSSLTVLNEAFKGRKINQSQTTSAGRPFKAALFGDPPTPAGSKALISLSKKLSVKPNMRDEFTTHRFKLASRDPAIDLIHYHSHAEFKDTNPKDQSLLFDDDDLSLSEVFEFAASTNACHLTLLGCGSGMTKTSAISGEVIGLVPAFLYSGAASTVSTLWPFDDNDAALYTRHFYEDIVRIVKEGRKGQVNLAIANQAAVLKIMDAKPELYHWAPFIFNGFWMFDVHGVTSNVDEA